MNRLLLLSLLLALLNIPIYAQSIGGKVTDSSNQEPVPFATVYLANTQMGHITAVDGTYQIEAIKPGRYDLTVSCVGYRLWTQPVNISKDSDLTVNISLLPDTIKLASVKVLPDTSDRGLNMPVFLKNFIGEVPNSSKCRVTNLKELHLYFDYPERTLFAHATQPLKIINDALGYNVYYDLVEFSLDYKKEKLLFFGIPRFESHENVKKRQLKSRKKSYQGSMSHFARLLINDPESFETQFTVQENFLVRNRRRPDQSFLDQKIRKFRSINNGTFTMNDSLIYYSRLNKLPVYLDSLGKVLHRKDFFNDNHQIRPGRYNILHNKSLEAANYPLAIRRKRRQKPLSTITVTAPLTVYQNGYIEGMKKALVQGYWAWNEKIANLLPLNYTPKP
jgi:hypothetical protein